MGRVSVTLVRPLHVSKVGQSKEKGKTKQATLTSDFHAHGSKKWELSLADSCNAELTSMMAQSILPDVRGSIPHWRCANTTGSHTLQAVRTPATVSYATDHVHIIHEHPQALLKESHITIGTIQQTQDIASVLLVYGHNSWHAAWPTVILRFM